MACAMTSGYQALCQRDEQSRHLTLEARAGAGRVKPDGIGPKRCQTRVCPRGRGRFVGCSAASIWERRVGGAAAVELRVQLDDVADVHQQHEWVGPRPRAAHGHNLWPGRELEAWHRRTPGYQHWREALFWPPAQAAEAEAVDTARAGGVAMLEGNGTLKCVDTVTAEPVLNCVFKA